ncbi:hypothetical protein [uncultured Rikenella sp.]|uniref:hypothetical protein n=1 Tax=uncultured Rikenella sp. TaxID=368003 RepID=UPI0026103216|nr:hypothetical protein [uncultured Rikenella sp.]
MHSPLAANRTRTAPGFRDAGYHGRLGEVMHAGDNGYSLSATSYTSNNHYRGLHLNLSTQGLYTSFFDHRAYGLQLRCLSE